MYPDEKPVLPSFDFCLRLRVMTHWLVSGDGHALLGTCSGVGVCRTGLSSHSKPVADRLEGGDCVHGLPYTSPLYVSYNGDWASSSGLVGSLAIEDFRIAQMIS